MLETSNVCGHIRWRTAVVALATVFLGACAVTETPEKPSGPAVAPALPPVSMPDPALAHAAALQEARALLAQAETDIQRARAKRALWLKAWESLVLARQASAAEDNAATKRHARRASELAQLGLEQLAYPAVP
jgi:hypothetical protein